MPSPAVENKVVYDVLDVISGKCRLKQALIQDVDNPTLYVLPSAKIQDSPLITACSFRNVVDALALNFDFVIIDCPAGIDNGFHRAVSAATEAIVVTTPHISAVRDADKVLSILSGYCLMSVGLVVNRVRGDMVSKGEMMSAGDIVRAVRCEPVGVIPEDDYITMYSQTGKVPFDTTSGRAFKMLASNVINGTQLIIKSLVESYGLTIGNKKGPGIICAVSTLENIKTHYENKQKKTHTTMNYSTKKELAMAYCPDIDYTAALKKLNQWIRNNTELSARLAATDTAVAALTFPQNMVLGIIAYTTAAVRRTTVFTTMDLRSL